MNPHHCDLCHSNKHHFLRFRKRLEALKPRVIPSYLKVLVLNFAAIWSSKETGSNFFQDNAFGLVKERVSIVADDMMGLFMSSVLKTGTGFRNDDFVFMMIVNSILRFTGN
ncbi:hypothetical protein CEXT_462911 [Caerostris extrusa]|uniref:Uncharacterized protein n=1 Tax=Caerostris extrusa TaxID=172846 RepID=A0AAV4TJB4_CAEEX|nr:hypothetical protein CEXT_462911 [Caerostris extrusa]